MLTVKIDVKNGKAKAVSAPAGWPFHFTEPVRVEVTYYDVVTGAAVLVRTEGGQ